MACSLVLIAWLTLHWGILPHIQQWRGPIEQRASEALGVPVRIGAIEVKSGGWVPSVELRDVVLLDARQAPALRLPRVFAALSPRSLLSFELRFEQLLIDGAELEVRRDARGRIFVAGLDLSGADKPDSHSGADWFFAQHEFVIRGGALRWTDEQRGAAPLALTDVQLIVRNGLRHHDFRLDATPPAEWGERFDVRARFTQPLLARRGDWQRWSGSVYADLPRADVRALRQHLTLPFEIDQGTGALRAWLDVKSGQVTAATVDVALRSVALRLAPEVEPLVVNRVEGRVVGERTAEGFMAAAQRFSFETADGVRWPAGDMKFAWRQREGQPASGGEFSATRLDIDLMAQVASRVPLAASVRKLLTELHPKGVVNALAATWDGPLDSPTRYRARGQIKGLALTARAADDPRHLGRPGVRGATVDFEASETGGRAGLAITRGAVELPGVFDDPSLLFDQLSTQVLWKIDRGSAAAAPPLLSVQLKDARFSNADASGELNAQWRTGPGAAAESGHGKRFPGRLELDAQLSNGLAQRVPRYLPSHMPKSLRDYLERAIQGGKITAANFHVKGDLWEFPYFEAKPAAGKVAAARDGEFRITGRIEDTAYAFLPGTATAPAVWPALAKTRLDLTLEHGTLDLRNASTQLGGVDFPQVQVAINHLDADPVLTLDAAGRGALTDMLRVVNGSPIGGWIDKALATAEASGTADLKLNLSIPLNRADTTAVKGSVTLGGNDVRTSPGTPLLAGAKGRVDFNNKGFNIVGATARLYGGEASFEGGTQADGALRFTGQGSVTAEGLRRATELGAAARAAGALSGQTSYRASLGFVHGQIELNLASNLVGMAIDLPAPLAKIAEAPLALRVSTTVDAVNPQALRDTLRVELGSTLQAQYLRDLSGPQPRVLRGGIGVLEPAPLPAAGVAAAITLPKLAVDEWQASAGRLFGGVEPGTDPAAPSAYVPNAIGLRVNELIAGQRRLTHVSAGLSQDAGVWRANVDADQLNGYIEYRTPARLSGVATAGGRVFARLSRLSLPKGDDEQVESLLDQQPEAMPALDVIVEDFELHGKRLGRVEIEALNRSTPQGRDWQLSKFNISTPEAQLIGSGHWSATGPAPARGTPTPRRAVMDFKLQIADSGALLARLGTSGAIKGGKGQLTGQVAWLGSPFALDYPTLTGQIAVAVDAGQFLKVEPGAARLLGVLSLQSLPRRLSLDFRDLFQEGFAFDNITGDVAIAQGVAKTNNLRMRGVQALVLMEGNADVARETQDLRVIVVPEINAGTAALAYAVINPAIGLGAFLAQALLKKPLTAANTREFHVSGPWAEPKVERVERKFGDDVPTGEPAAPAAKKE
jgi:uncharacterized protein (TIGR02099 family)